MGEALLPLLLWSRVQEADAGTHLLLSPEIPDGLVSTTFCGGDVATINVAYKHLHRLAQQFDYALLLLITLEICIILHSSLHSHGAPGLRGGRQ